MTIDYTKPEFQTQLKERLYAETVLVSFNKANGERRDMYCTLKPDVIPAATERETTSTRVAPVNSLAVYDTTAQGWRSFRWDSIIEVK